MCFCKNSKKAVFSFGTPTPKVWTVFGEGACDELTEVVAALFCFSIVATKIPQFYPDFTVI